MNETYILFVVFAILFCIAAIFGAYYYFKNKDTKSEFSRELNLKERDIEYLKERLKKLENQHVNKVVETGNEKFDTKVNQAFESLSKVKLNINNPSSVNAFCWTFLISSLFIIAASRD